MLVQKCIEHLNIKPITTKGQTNYYSDDDFIKFTTFINNKLSELNSLNNYLTKRQICKKLKLHYDKFETLCKKFNITPIFDWEFGKDSKLYSNESFNFLFNLIEENKKQSEIKYTITELSKIFQKTDSCIAKVIEKLNIPYFESITRGYLIDDKSFLILQDYFSKTEISGSSYFEKEICEFVKSIYSNEIVENDRKIIYPKELDIYIPDYNVAIEYNGTYWHSSLYKDKNYHYDKSKLCEEKGIRLIHIWEYEWENERQRPILENIILSACGKIQNKIYARNCKIEIRESKNMKQFFEENNIQGFRGGKFAICLIYNNEVVMSYIMGKAFFGKGKYEWEVIRGATKLGCSVIGGASKIWKYFKNNYNPQSCVYYVDYNYFNGQSIQYLDNFKFIKTQPSFKNWWRTENKIKNRDPLHHEKIKELEKEGLVIPIYNAGTKVYVWEKY